MARHSSLFFFFVAHRRFSPSILSTFIICYTVDVHFVFSIINPCVLKKMIFVLITQSHICLGNASYNACIYASEIEKKTWKKAFKERGFFDVAVGTIKQNAMLIRDISCWEYSFGIHHLQNYIDKMIPKCAFSQKLLSNHVQNNFGWSIFIMV